MPNTFKRGEAYPVRTSAGDQHAIQHTPCVCVRQVITIGPTLDCLFLEAAFS
jgi:hypothetical protein